METKGHKELRRFLRLSELTAADLAALAGLMPMQIYHLLHGRRRASLTVAVALEEASRGAVKTKSWMKRA